MNKTIFLLAVAAGAFLLPACKKVIGEGPVVTENRTRENYKAIAVRISGNVYYSPDSVYRLQILAQQNILDIIETPVVNNELVIRYKNNVNVRSADEIIIHVSAPDVTSLAVSGSGNLQTSGDLQPHAMRLDVSGSGNLTLAYLETPVIDATVSGSGNIAVSGGSGVSGTVKISGSGSIDLVNVPVENASSTTTGSGTMRLHVTEDLTVKITGSGNVYYKGTPRISSNVSGSGRLIPL